MSDTMILGVLRMPPEIWSDEELDKRQRHARYLEAARLIVRMQDALEEIRALAAENHDPEADPSNESPADMTQHVNGLIVRLCDEILT